MSTAEEVSKVKIMEVPQTCIEAIDFRILLLCSPVSMPGPPRSNNILPFMHCISIYGSLTGFPLIHVPCPKIVGTGISVNFAMYFIVAISLSMVNCRSAVHHFSILFWSEVEEAGRIGMRTSHNSPSIKSRRRTIWRPPA